MADTKPPMIPPPIWERMQAFLEAKETGSLTLQVKNGQILGIKRADSFNLS